MPFPTAMPQPHVKVLTVAWRQQVKVKLKVLTVAARMSWGQHAKRKDLHTFGSLYFVPADSPEKNQVSKKKLLQWINVQQSPTSESCTLQNRTFSQLKNISLWETLSLWFVCLLVFPWEKTADKQKFYKKNLLYHLALFSLTQGRFSEDSRTSTRFVFQTQKPLFYILCCSMNNAKF